MNENDAQCLLNLGVCKVDQRDLAAGEALIRRAIAIDGDKARSWTNLGVALALQNRHDAAFEAFERADSDRRARPATMPGTSSTSRCISGKRGERSMH